ncbi:MAG: GNAT family N-acetyltransferase [Peptococcaceae bacterium]|nr:GNAT family N-acetyltransferase [Peptococcaceae bacterium]
MQKIAPHLWYDKEAKEAKEVAEFYIGLFDQSKLISTTVIGATPSGNTDIVSEVRSSGCPHHLPHSSIVYSAKGMIRNMSDFTAFPALETSRLLLRRMSHDDVEDLFAMRQDARMHKHTDTKPDETAAETFAYIDKMNRGVDGNRWLIWAIEHRQSHKVVGTICVWNIDRENNSGELGYGIVPDYQEQGLANNRVYRLIVYGLDRSTWKQGG